MAEHRKQEEQQAASPEQVVRAAVADTEPKSDSEELPVEQLIEFGPQYTGYDAHAVAGALAGVTRKKLTVEEAKAAVRAWLNSPVKQED